LGDFEYEVQVPYLLYRNASQEVNGIWFYNSRECEEVANLFSRYSIFLVQLFEILVVNFLFKHLRVYCIFVDRTMWVTTQGTNKFFTYIYKKIKYKKTTQGTYL
jgi:hypothetical protein